MSMPRWPEPSVERLHHSASIHITGHDKWEVQTTDAGVPIVTCECGWTSESESFDRLAKEVLDHLRPLLDERQD